MKKNKWIILLVLLISLSACDKKIEDDIEITSIFYEQEIVFYDSTFQISDIMLEVTYQNDTKAFISLEESMLNQEDLIKLQQAGLHEIKVTYADQSADFVLYIAGVDQTKSFSYIWIVEPDYPIPSNEFSFHLIEIWFVFDDETYEAFELSEGLVNKDHIMSTYDIGEHLFEISFLEYTRLVSVTMTHPNITYTDDRELYDGQLPDDLVTINTLFFGGVGSFNIQARVALITTTGFILYDGENHVFLNYDHADYIKLNDEVWVNVAVDYYLGTYSYYAIDVKLIERYRRDEIEPVFYELKTYMTQNKIVDREIKYRFRGIFTYFDNELVFTDGIYELKGLIFDDETLDIINQYIHTLVDVNFYYGVSGLPPKFILDKSDLDISELEEIYQEAYHEFFLDLEIKHLKNSMPDVITNKESLFLATEGLFGSTIRWTSQNTNIISSLGVVQPSVNKYTCTSIMFDIDNDKMNKGQYKDICITAGTPMTLAQADAVSFDRDYEVIVKGIVVNSVYDISIIYDGTSYALVKYEGIIGEIVEIHGFYERYEGYLGGLSYPYIVRPLSETFDDPMIDKDFDFSDFKYSDQMLGYMYEVSMSYQENQFEEKWDAFQAMGGLPYIFNKGVFKIDGTNTIVYLVGNDEIDFTNMQNQTIKFSIVGINELGYIEGVFINE